MDKTKALESALAQIERLFGKGSIMKLGQDNPFSTVPDSYAYWLEKRADIGFKDRTSTWLKGIDTPQV